MNINYLLLYFLIREMNKKLYDSNDGLRSALASQMVAAKRRVSSLFAQLRFLILAGIVRKNLNVLPSAQVK